MMWPSTTCSWVQRDRAAAHTLQPKPLPPEGAQRFSAPLPPLPRKLVYFFRTSVEPHFGHFLSSSLRSSLRRQSREARRHT